MGDGIYALTADLKGVDLSSNLAVVADPNDTSQAKAPGWTVSGSTNSAFHISLDAAGNIIAGDWSDPNGGIKYASADSHDRRSRSEEYDGSYGVVVGFRIWDP